MKKFYKFLFVLLSLVMGGVGAPVSVNAQKYYTDTDAKVTYTVVREATINIMRATGDIDGKEVTVDLSDAFDVGVIDNSTNWNSTNWEVHMLNSNGTYANTEYDTGIDGWVDASGNPKTWGTGSVVCIKFFQIKTISGKLDTSKKTGTFETFHYYNTEQAGNTYFGKWAIVNTSDKTAIIYTVNVTFYTPITNISYGYSLSTDNAFSDGTTEPPLWGWYGEKDMIKLYMGGWKYQTSSQLADKYKYTSSEYWNNKDEEDEKNGKYITDGWEVPGALANYGDGNSTSDINIYYQYYFKDGSVSYRQKSYGKGDNANARSEFLANTCAGKYKKSFAKRGDEFGKGNPFTVPCFGTFLKLEPEQNGMVQLYLVQNGIIDLSVESGGESKLNNKASWRPTYIVDELGNQLTDKNGVTAELPKTRRDSKDTSGTTETTDASGQKIYIGWDGSYYGKYIKDNGYDLPNSDDANEGVINAFLGKVNGSDLKGKLSDEQWGKLTGYSKDATDMTDDAKKVYDNPYWTTGGTEMRIMPPSDSQDGWVAINKTYVKYTFPVKAGKSYYVLNNDSQIAFCGYTFTAEGALQNEITINEQGEYSIKNGGNGNIENIPAGSYGAVKVQRSFKPGWNAICLPFSVTESKMREWFGSDGNTEDYELVTFNGCKKTAEEEEFTPSTTPDGLTAHFFRHAYQDIIAGYPYMIYIPKGAKALSSNTITFQNITIEKDAEMATFSSSHDYMDNNNENKYTLAKEDDFEYRGTYVPTGVRAGSYVVYSTVAKDDNGEDKVTSTGIRYVSSAATMKGLRAYLYPKYLDEPKQMNAVARIVGTNFSEIFDDSMWNDATVINDLMEEMGFFDQRENVYSITGQIVRQNTTSLVGLPKGIYIVKGKKYFVK